ncbi:glycoside hydrolase family 15 protein [Dongia soli]|uniref:Glycoside hydrolase family 15 protein n=1 Tax=Dongia soli TaxID=600628 RepID=A0ABU5EDQ2_9PROT|nr:glycoside hydrolase family 15 protein [Dongia soli]MDY0884194.1 glycoside hydrolase family 15 protein [Dongia soli]
MDFAVIGNCTIAAIINKMARHVWFCFPRLDSDPAFNALVNDPDPQSGFMDVQLDRFASSEQRYLRNTAVVETILTAEDGASLRIVDFAPRFKRFGRQFRPPMIIRRIEPLNGRCRITVRLRPSFGYGTMQPNKTFGSNHMRFVSGAAVLRLTTDIPVSYIDQEVSFILHRPVNLFLGSDESVPERPDTLARQFLEETVGYWQDWVRDLAVPFEWQSAVIRAAITLKLCSYEDTGAIVAALTTSLPEHAGSGRNWDYRYCWMRDAFFTVHSLNRLGATLTMENYLTYVLDAVLSTDLGELAPLYPIVPGSSTEEIISSGLRGFQGMGPVRIGNAAAGQRQNDIYGSVILAAAQMFWDDRLPRPGDLSLYHQLRPIGIMAQRLALEPDAGIWEYRGRSRPHTFSAMMCWAAVHRLGLIAGKVGETDDAAQWLGSAMELREKIIARAWNEQGGYFAGSLGGSEVDAALLLMPEIGLVSYNDPHFLATLRIIEQRLLRNGLMMRYAEADDFGMPESAFLVCSFWYVDTLVACGRHQEARDLFQRILDLRNHVGLLSEDVALDSGELWGNFPQTYSMVGLIHSALRLSRSWEEGVWRVS